jgi:argininosuccinate synthase
MSGKQKKTVILAYSGGVDTSVAVHWLVERGYRVVAFMADVGQPGAYQVLKQRAKQAGAAQVIVHDVQEEFAEQYIWPALKADALYEGKYLLATSLSRPLIAQHLVEVAHAVGADTVAHGCTGKGNDQVRFELTTRMLDPRLEIIAPVRIWEFKSREEEIDYLAKQGIAIEISKKSPYSIDENIWGISIEAGVMEDPWAEPPKDTFRSVQPLEQAEARAEEVTIEFVEGLPRRVNGKAYAPVALIKKLNEIGGKHGIGRVDMIESRVVGIKSREVYEAPAGTILYQARQDLQRMVFDARLLQIKQQLALTYADLVYQGLWFTPLRRALDAFVNETQKRVNGKVRLKLYRGNAVVVGRSSPDGLYRQHLATYSAEDQFDQRYSEGFIKLFGLPYEGSAAKTLTRE